MFRQIRKIIKLADKYKGKIRIAYLFSFYWQEIIRLMACTSRKNLCSYYTTPRGGFPPSGSVSMYYMPARR